MKKVLAFLLVGVGMTLCAASAEAQVVTYYNPVVASPAYGYGSGAATVVRYPRTTYYAPAVAATPCCGGAVAAPVTAYYAPSVPVTTYYAPSVPVTSYYAPAPTYYAPVSYYAPSYTVVRRGLFRAPVVVGY